MSETWLLDDEQIEAYEDEISDLKAELARAQARVEVRRDLLMARLREAAGVPADVSVLWNGSGFVRNDGNEEGAGD